MDSNEAVLISSYLRTVKAYAKWAEAVEEKPTHHLDVLMSAQLLADLADKLKKALPELDQ